MVNRILLIGTGAILAGVLSAVAYVRESEAGRGAAETVIYLEEGRDQRQLMAKPTPKEGTVIYSCSDGQAFAVAYGQEGGRATLSLGGDSVVLEPIYAASGAHYTDGFFSLRVEGEAAAVALGDDITLPDCRMEHKAAEALAEAGG